MEFFESNLDLLLSIALFVVTLIWSIISFIVKGKKNDAKATLYAMIPSFVREAEAIIRGDKMGAMRQNFVMTKAVLYATQNNLKIKQEEIDALISEEVKTLNFNKTSNQPFQEIKTETATDGIVENSDIKNNEAVASTADINI